MPVKFTFQNPMLKTWLQIHQIHNLMRRVENSILSDLGLTDRKHSVLLALENLENPVSVTDVARWLDRNPNGISMLVNRMEKDGLVNKVRDQADQRVVRIEITKKGEDCFERSRKNTRDVIRNIFSGISEDDMLKMTGLLKGVREKALDYLKLDYGKEITEVLPDNIEN